MSQSMRELGFENSARTLENEAGVSAEEPVVQQLETHVLKGDWNEAVALLGRALGGAGDANADCLRRCRRSVLRAKFTELVAIGDIKSALACLQDELQPICTNQMLSVLGEMLLQDTDELVTHGRSFSNAKKSVTSRGANRKRSATKPFDTKGREISKGAGAPPSGLAASRAIVMAELREILPSSMVLPKHRLLSLLDHSMMKQLGPCEKPETTVVSLARDAEERVSKQVALPVHRVQTIKLVNQTEQVLSLINQRAQERAHGGDANDSDQEDGPESDLGDHLNEVYCVVFNPAGTQVAAGLSDGSVILFDVTEPSRRGDGRVLSERARDAGSQRRAAIYALAFSKNGSQLAAGNQMGTVVLWDVGERRMVKAAELTVHSKHVTKVVWLDSKRFFSSSHDNTIQLVNVDGERLAFVRGFPVFDIAFSETHNVLFAACGGPRMLRMFTFSEASALRQIRELPWDLANRFCDPGSAVVTRMALSSDGETLVTNLLGDRIVEWNVATGGAMACYSGAKMGRAVLQASLELWGHTQTVNGVAWSPVEASLLVSASSDGTLAVWHSSANPDQAEPNRHGGWAEPWQSPNEARQLAACQIEEQRRMEVIRAVEVNEAETKQDECAKACDQNKNRVGAPGEEVQKALMQAAMSHEGSSFDASQSESSGAKTANSHGKKSVKFQGVSEDQHLATAKAPPAAKKPPRRASKRNSARKRRRTDAQACKPDPTLYVGYVEEGETVEMIMKKFEKLEEIKRKVQASDVSSTETGKDGSRTVSPEPNACAPSDGPDDKSSGTQRASIASAGPGKGDDATGLSQDALLEVFNQTSAFTVEAATRLHSNVEHDEFGFYHFDDGWEMDGVISHEREDGQTVFLFGDGTDDDIWDEVFSKKKRGRQSSGSGGRQARAGTRASDGGVTHIHFISDKHGRFVTGLKKVRTYDPNAMMYTKIPNEITMSWAKRIEPFRPRDAIHRHTTWRPDAIVINEDQFFCSTDAPPCSQHLAVHSVLDVDLTSLVGARGSFEGIVLSPPWKDARIPVRDSDSDKRNLAFGIEPEDLLKLSLGRSQILKSGFVYVWTPKHLILRVLRVLEKMNFHYVENAICVKQHVHNDFFCEPSRYFRQSKETLLICRRGTKSKSGKITWERVEIRHQRTSDVHFETVRPDPHVRGAHQLAHNYVHNMVETMLPHGRFNPLPSLKEATAAVDKSAAAAVPSSRLIHLWAPPK
ncbi:WD repeat-containing protein 26 homolog (AtWDR26), partial [Durusdinium trenchii]